MSDDIISGFRKFSELCDEHDSRPVRDRYARGADSPIMVPPHVFRALVDVIDGQVPPPQEPRSHAFPEKVFLFGLHFEPYYRNSL